jgi:hypothetical protein
MGLARGYCDAQRCAVRSYVRNHRNAVDTDRSVSVKPYEWLDVTTITLRIQGNNLVVLTPEWDQLTTEYVHVPLSVEHIAELVSVRTGRPVEL